jgi:hypothetical protein
MAKITLQAFPAKTFSVIYPLAAQHFEQKHILSFNP